MKSHPALAGRHEEPSAPAARPAGIGAARRASIPGVLPEERLRLGIAAALLLFVYGAAFAFVVRSLVLAVRTRRGGAAAPPLRPALRRARVAVHVLAATGLLCAVYARFVEPYWPEVTHARVECAKLHSRPIRIAQISDVHSDPTARLEPEIPDLIAAERPDVILFTGDALNSPGGLDNFRTLMTRLAAIAPTYAVRGNWDVWYWGAIDLFGGTGVTELDGTAVQLPGRADVWIAGVPVGGLEAVPGMLAAIPRDAVSIFLYHYPDEIEDLARRGVDLYVAGHTHGGQVALPFYGALVTLSRYGKRFESGLYQVGGTALYVNRGIGMEGGAAPRVRFMARPEISIIELAPPRA
jgi:predicted MPP superfamily phosphohydrolase